MYLEKLKLFGFKSFAKKTTLELLPGITAIVGPNGCGKSNIVDALRWVLGEQKAGTLRSDRMESVIFNGSKSMKPLGMAEVALVIQNSDNRLPVDYSEVVITRRLFRSGESQYLINNNPCRLKDINDMLMDTGLAPDAYSVIELAMVEQILNGKPEDRRRIFEEAVGLTKYKQRRKLTFRKLDATEQDLVRLADIIGEVKSKVNSLHRQVRRAQRYQSLSKNLTDAEIRVATHRYSQIYEELEPLNQQFEELNRNKESLSSQISFKDAEVETIQTDLIEHDDKLKAAQNLLTGTNYKIQKQEEEILLSRERLKSLAENKTRISDEIKDLKRRITSRKEQLSQTQQQKSTTSSEISQLQERHDAEKQILVQMEQQLNDKKAAARQVEQQIISMMQVVSEKQRTFDRLTDQIEHQKQRVAALNHEKEDLLSGIKSDEKMLKDFRDVLDRQHVQMENLTESLSESELKSEMFSSKIAELKSSILKKNNQLDAGQQRIGFLKELLESYADYPEGVKHLLVDQGAEKGFTSALADNLVVDEKNRKAIEAALGEAATYLIVNNAQTAYLGIDTLKTNKKGIVTFLPLDQLNKTVSKPDLPSVKGVVGWADQIVSCDNKLLPAIQILLGSYLIVEDVEVAQKIAGNYSGKNVHLVTQSGEIFFSWGALRGGKKETESESLIGRQDQLKKLIQQSEILNSELEQNETDLKTSEIALSEINRQISETIQSSKKLQAEISEQQIKISQVDYRIQQAKKKIQQLESEIQTLTNEQQPITEQISQNDLDLKQNSERLATQQNEIQAFQQQVEKFEHDRNLQADKVNQLKLKIVEIAGNERSLSQAYEQTERLIEEHEATIQIREKDLVENDAQQSQLEYRIDELGEQLSADYTLKEEHEKAVAELEQKSRSLRQTVDEKSKVIKQLRSERDAVSEKLHHIELRISELRIKADNMYRRIMEEYDWELKREDIDENYDVSVDEAEIEKIRERVKRLGPVNLLALKEYEKEKERLDFLEKQQEDLITAEQNLKETIEHINKTAQDKFDSIFNDIRNNFITVFKGFFPNGESDLLIEDNGDPLEANIEIVANPKGKRMESLTLLSGGEKALTAISLLFGIYLVKPSPICILDEVDAPLDDTNVKRFINTLNQFSKSTQFLMVTHNKMTMKAAHSLYGITMEESGVSKVVSVKLE